MARTDVDADGDRAQRVGRRHHRPRELGGAQAGPEGAAVLAEGLLQLLHQPVRVRDLRLSAASSAGLRAFMASCAEPAPTSMAKLAPIPTSDMLQSLLISASVSHAQWRGLDLPRPNSQPAF